MELDRRTALKAGAGLFLSAGLPRFAFASGAFNLEPGPWRTFQIVTRLACGFP